MKGEAMILLKGTIENGRVVLPRPADLPDGTEVTVLAHGSASTLGIPDDQWPTTPRGHRTPVGSHGQRAALGNDPG